MNRAVRFYLGAVFALLLILAGLIGCSAPPLPTAVPENVDPSQLPTFVPTAVFPFSDFSDNETLPESGAFIPPATASDTLLGRIAFISANGRLGTINPDGTETRYLTPANGVFQFPAWSPTGETLAVIGNLPTGSGVFTVQDEAESDLVPIYTGSSPIYLYWKPDGTQVSFIAQHRNGLGLYLAAPDGSTESRLLATGQPLYWNWHPDGERALTHRGREPLAYVDLEGNADDLDVGRGVFQAPGVSPSGQFVAYSEQAGRNDPSFLTVWDENRGETLFSEAHVGAVALSWSPTADVLAYISPIRERATFFGPLRLYDAVAENGYTAVGEDVLAFFWSPDGRYIAYLALTQGGQQAMRKHIRGKPAQQQQLRVTLFLLDIENRTQQTLYSYNLPRLFITQFLPFFDQYALSHRVWSPDSRYIVLPVRDNDDENITRIAVIPRDGSPPTFIADGVTAFWSH